MQVSHLPNFLDFMFVDKAPGAWMVAFVSDCSNPNSRRVIRLNQVEVTHGLLTFLGSLQSM
jgi:hypothetical protein